MAKICNSKPVKIVLIVAIIILAIVFGFVFYQKMSDEQQEKEANADDDVSYDVPDASDINVKEGRYYLNGDTSSYYLRSPQAITYSSTAMICMLFLKSGIPARMTLSKRTLLIGQAKKSIK